MASLYRRPSVFGFPVAVYPKDPKTAWFLPAQKVVRIHGVERQHVTNPVSIDANERRWSFTPEQPWKPGEYRVDIDSLLEDVAANRVDHVFDVDTAENRCDRDKKPISALPIEALN